MTDQEPGGKEQTPTPASVLKQYWGYETFRPLQQAAIEAVMNQEDSVVVLPTGGGKSLCYQVPAMLREGMAIVVSPLIALMKDQVGALTDVGIAAAAVNSSLDFEERREIADRIRAGEIKILYIAPERLCTPRMREFLSDIPLSFIAVDEAHCISHWGHNFRPEFRLMGQLREQFPEVDFHAYTATATEQVREDIADQLSLKSPHFLVGNFDRPNLTYRVTRRRKGKQQILDVVERYPDQAGIIYCISRKQVDDYADWLKSKGFKAVGYHAGMENEDRTAAQDDFLNEKADIVVATVAFGMGIDKPNVRYVIHASATKSIENYQQEAGRAGRDGLPAECCLFYGPGDFITWKKILSDLTGEAAEVALEQLKLKENFCLSINCRHQTLVEHFGQEYEGDNCAACDICLREVNELDNALVVSQKILSCVYRVEQRFGADYVASVLTGSQDQRILENNHDQLSTYGLLSDQTKAAVREWTEQLISQNCLERVGEYGVLELTPIGRSVFKEEFIPRLLEPIKKARYSSKSSSSAKAVELTDQEQFLFEYLRQLRRDIAEEKNIPPFIVFGDTTLIDLSRRRPSSTSGFLKISGVGEKKCDQYGDQFLHAIRHYCDEHELNPDPDL